MSKFTFYIQGENEKNSAIKVEKKGMKAIQFSKEMGIEETNYIFIKDEIVVQVPFEKIKESDLLQQIFSDTNSVTIVVPDCWCNDIFNFKEYYESEYEEMTLYLDKFLAKFNKDFDTIVQLSKDAVCCEDFYKKFKNLKTQESNCNISDDQKINRFKLDKIKDFENISIELFYIIENDFYIPVAILNSNTYKGFDNIKNFYYDFIEQIDEETTIETINDLLKTFIEMINITPEFIIPNKFIKLLEDNKDKIENYYNDLLNNCSDNFAPKNIMWCLQCLKILNNETERDEGAENSKYFVANQSFKYLESSYDDFYEHDFYFDLIIMEYLNQNFAIPVPILAKILQVKEEKIYDSFDKIESRNKYDFI